MQHDFILLDRFGEAMARTSQMRNLYGTTGQSMNYTDEDKKKFAEK